MSLRAANLMRQSAQYFGALSAQAQALADLKALKKDKPKAAKKLAAKLAKQQQSAINQQIDKKQAKQPYKLKKPALLPEQLLRAEALSAEALAIFKGSAAGNIYKAAKLAAAAEAIAAKANARAEQAAKLAAEAIAKEAAAAAFIAELSAESAEAAAFYEAIAAKKAAKAAAKL